MKSELNKLNRAINKEQKHDRRDRKRELNKRYRKSDNIGGSKASYKKTTHKFNSIT